MMTCRFNHSRGPGAGVGGGPGAGSGGASCRAVDLNKEQFGQEFLGIETGSGEKLEGT